MLASSINCLLFLGFVFVFVFVSLFVCYSLEDATRIFFHLFTMFFFIELKGKAQATHVCVKTHCIFMIHIYLRILLQIHHHQYNNTNNIFIPLWQKERKTLSKTRLSKTFVVYVYILYI